MNGAIEVVRKLGPARLAAMVAVTLLLIAFFGFVMLRVTQPSMALLYSDLSVPDATAIIRDLETKGIRYETRGEGQVVLVPSEMVTRLRIDFAGKGVPTGGGVGYEIFDKGDAFSSTSFVQGINQLRALEGELSRTIRSLARVQAARVHLVLPERRLFERDRDPPRASIVLKLAGELDAAQVRAVRHLVASAVDGLKPDRISIVDERGRLLADGAQGDTAMTIGLDEKQANIERRLRGQVEEIVAGIVGQGRARVQVAAEIDANRIENRSETFDPESRVVRSTQTRTEAQQSTEAREAVSVGNELPGANQPQQQAQPTPRDSTSKNEEIINYEISRQTRTEVIEGGRVKRLSVAVLVDGIYAKAGNAAPTYQERPKEELDRIAALVRTAIGFDGKRGDQLEVVNLRFAEAPPSFADKETSWMASLFAFGKDDVLRVAELAVIAILTCIVLLTVVRPLVRRVLAPDTSHQRGHGGGGHSGMLVPASPGGGTSVALGGGADAAGPLPVARHSNTMQMLDIAKVSGQMQSQSVERVGELIRNNPQETVSILREWIHQEE